MANDNEAHDKYMRSLYEDSSEDEEAGVVLLPKNVINSRLKKRSTKLAREDTLKQPLVKPCFTFPPTTEKEDFPLNEDFKIPDVINQYLRDYQRKGVMFLFESFIMNNGCILADDMGLGKTIQVIALLASILHKTGHLEEDREKKSEEIFLIIAPSSVLYNWIDELNSWGHFRIGKFHRANKAEVIESVSKGEIEIVLTTYETMRIYLDMLIDITWSMIICDEVHRIKSKDSQLTVACKQLKSNSRAGLTGTPLQNDLTEFWCVLDWANPLCFGTYDLFEQQFARPIYIGQRYKATKRELATARKKQQELSVIHRKWLLRRTKEMIADQLPEKDEKIVFCKLSKIQISIYEEILQLPKVKLLLQIDRECECGSKLIAKKCCYKSFNWRRWIFPGMQLLLKVSNHAALLLHNAQSDEQKQIAKDLCSKLFKKHPSLQDLIRKQNLLQMSDPTFCGKMTITRKLLLVHQKKCDKVLIFSHSIQLLNILETYLISCGMIYRRLDGSTPVQSRNILVKEFNNDLSIFVCLLSTTAGSLGLNFIGANVVIIFDPMWNPSFDQQAQDRAYRIGQRKNVKVYRLISIGTIEESIYMRQIYKQQLSNIAVEMSKEPRYFNAVPKDKNFHGELYGVSNLFKFNPDHTSIFAKEVFEKVKYAENDIEMAKYHQSEKPSKQKNEDFDDCCEINSEDSDNEMENPIKYLESQVNDENLNVPLSTKHEVDDKNNKNDELFTKINKKPETNGFDSQTGVCYGYSTKSLIGTNKTEELISKKAMKDVFRDGCNSQEMANNIKDDQFSEDSYQLTSVEEMDFKMPSIKSYQFAEIASFSGYCNVDEFAQVISKYSPAKIKTLLHNFYEKKSTSRKKQIPNLFQANKFLFKKFDSPVKDVSINKKCDSVSTIGKSSTFCIPETHDITDEKTLFKTENSNKKCQHSLKFESSFSIENLKQNEKINLMKKISPKVKRKRKYKTAAVQSHNVVASPTISLKYRSTLSSTPSRRKKSNIHSKYSLEFSPQQVKGCPPYDSETKSSLENKKEQKISQKHNVEQPQASENAYVSSRSKPKQCCNVTKSLKKEYSVLDELLNSQNDNVLPYQQIPSPLSPNESVTKCKKENIIDSTIKSENISLQTSTYKSPFRGRKCLEEDSVLDDLLKDDNSFLKPSPSREKSCSKETSVLDILLMDNEPALEQPSKPFVSKTPTKTETIQLKDCRTTNQAKRQLKYSATTSISVLDELIGP